MDMNAHVSQVLTSNISVHVDLHYPSPTPRRIQPRIAYPKKNHIRKTQKITLLFRKFSLTP